jgi:hypothetical protein
MLFSPYTITHRDTASHSAHRPRFALKLARPALVRDQFPGGTLRRFFAQLAAVAKVERRLAAKPPEPDASAQQPIQQQAKWEDDK